MQGQLIAEQEVLFGSKPSPAKTPSSRKMLRTMTMGHNRRQSVSGAAQQNPKPELLNSKSMSVRKDDVPASPYTGSFTSTLLCLVHYLLHNHSLKRN